MRVNYGRQQWYRLHQTEPACRSCEHFGGEEKEGGWRWCAHNKSWAKPEGICNYYYREAGAD